MEGRAASALISALVFCGTVFLSSVEKKFQFANLHGTNAFCLDVGAISSSRLSHVAKKFSIGVLWASPSLVTTKLERVKIVKTETRRENPKIQLDVFWPQLHTESWLLLCSNFHFVDRTCVRFGGHGKDDDFRSTDKHMVTKSFPNKNEMLLLFSDNEDTPSTIHRDVKSQQIRDKAQVGQLEISQTQLGFPFLQSGHFIN